MLCSVPAQLCCLLHRSSLRPEVHFAEALAAELGAAPLPAVMRACALQQLSCKQAGSTFAASCGGVQLSLEVVPLEGGTHVLRCAARGAPVRPPPIRAGPGQVAADARGARGVPGRRGGARGRAAALSAARGGSSGQYPPGTSARRDLNSKFF